MPVDASSSAREPVAVIGMALRFPGANDTPDQFADFLRANGSGIVPVPTDRWGGAVRVGTGPGEIRTRAGGFLDRIDEFDAPFFNIAPKQAHYVDPQQRLLLQTAWTAFEDANVDPAGLRHGNGGVYIGATPFDYALELERLSYPDLDGALATGIGGYPMCGRLSYFLGWRGPSLTTDTACASALTALHLAVEGLLAGECDIALCGAVNVLHHPRIFAILSNGQVLAQDGRCKTFDDAADGYARAEGCGVLLLKRLSAALADGDPIRALIRGTVIGQDGESAGLTAPNGAAQQQAIRLALRRAGLTPGDIQYVEAHGTGTPLGDPLELSSIDAVFGDAHRAGQALVVGSVKANIGHMEPAAGVGGLIKVILQMRDGVFFPHRYDTPSGRVPWDTYPITVPTTCLPWTGRPKRAVVNGFGLAGAIGVAVLEEPPPATAEPTDADDGWSVFTLSAKSRPALARQIDRYRDFAAARPEVPAAGICRTRNLGRTHFRHRIAGLVAHNDDLVALLDRAATELAADSTPPKDVRRTAFLFTGSGAQYPGMGAGLYRRFAEFRRSVDECDELFRPHIGRSVRELMFDVPSSDTDPLLGTVAAHAALFTVEYALARLLLSWGIRPNVLLGHSVGELIAATVAGVFTLSDGIALLAARAKLIESVPVPGGMAAVAAGADEIAPLLAAEPLLSIAAINAPDRCVVSGASADLDRVGALLRERGHVVTPLAVSSAFHSPLMRDIAAELRDVVAGLDPREPEISVVSNLTGALAGPAELSDPDYWARHLCQPVNFVAGMRAVAERGRHAVIELGPSATLTTLARRCVPADGQLWLSCLRRGDETGQTLGDSLARLYAAGAKLDWAAVHGDGRDRRTALPTYAFERKRYWLPASGPPVRGAVAGDGHPLLGAPVDGHGTEFSVHVGTGRPAYLADHTAAGQAFLPAMLCVELALAVADVRHGHTRVPLTDIRFDTALPLADRLTELRITTTTRPDGRTEVAVSGRDAADGDWRRHASAVVGGGESISAPSPAGVALLRLLARPGEPTGEMDTEQVYAAYARADLDYGPEFRRAGRLVRYGGDLVVGEVRGSGVATGEHAPPPVLDAATHGLAMLADDGRRYISVGIAEVRVFRKPRAAVLRSVLRRVPAAGTDGIAFTVDALLLDGEQPVAELRGMAFRELTVPVMPSPAAGNGACQANAANSTENGTHRHTAIRDVIRTTVADLLRIDDPADIDEHATFLELGIDSLVGLQVKTVLENRFAVALRGSVVFDHPTTADLADFLDRMSHQGPRNENG